MSRNTAARKSAREGFAELLEDLTQNSVRPPAARTEVEKPTSRIAWRTASEADTREMRGTGADGRREKRTALPLGAVYEKRLAEPEDGVELSYEKALRLHARHRMAMEDEFDVPAEPAVARGAASESAIPMKPVLDRSHKAGKRRANAAVAQSNAAPRQPEAMADPLAGSLERSLGRGRGSDAGQVNPHGQRSGRRTRITPGKDQKVPSPKDVMVSSLAGGNMSPPSGCDLIAPARPGVLCDAPESTELARNDLPLQRRTVVSVRLTAEELERLRERAEEAGISVSAYMRSCVLDAENLRAQVKHAMAEIRSLGAVSLVHRRAALQPVSREGSGGRWLRTLWRSATTFLNPFSPDRRSA